MFEQLCGVIVLLLLLQMLLVEEESLEEDIYAVCCMNEVQQTFSWRTLHELRRAALVPPKFSPITYLLNGGDDHAYLITMGVDIFNFNFLAELVDQHFRANRDRRGKKSAVDARQKIGG